MSWGATAFTPIISYNAPPFGFEERQNLHDYPTCPENPYISTEKLKREFAKVLSTQPISNCSRESFIGDLFSKSPEKGLINILNKSIIILVMAILVYLIFHYK